MLKLAAHRGAASAALGMRTLIGRNLFNNATMTATIPAHRAVRLPPQPVQGRNGLTRCFSSFTATTSGTPSCNGGSKYVNNLLMSAAAFRDALLRQPHRFAGNTELCSTPNSRGLVLGVYANEEDKLDIGILTENAARYNETSTNGRLLELLRIAGPMPKRGEFRMFYALEPNFTVVVVVGLGHKCLGYDSHEQIDEGKEAIRIAAATGCRALQALETNKIYIETFGNAEAAAEGAMMSIWVFQKLRNKSVWQYVPQVDMHVERGLECDWEGWKIGVQKASAQNLARELMECPANLMTPTKFAQNVVNVLCDSGVNVEVKVRGWAETQQMSAFLAIAKGSCEPPIFLELSYYGSDHSERPIVLVGQGNTFDCGGICLKPQEEMLCMRGDMCGAAAVVSTCRAIASLRLPVNLRALIPLCEHMIGCNAIKPGDVIKAMNGKSIEVEDTDYEGAIVLVDALLYAQIFSPRFIIDVGTISTDIFPVLGDVCSGIYTNSEDLWQQMKSAGVHSGDRVWRMPLWEYFSRLMCSSPSTDVQNFGLGRGGGACKGAAFLREFVPCGPWMHVEARGVLTTTGKDYAYLKAGMAGRPTRTLIEFIAQTVCHDIDNKEC